MKRTSARLLTTLPAVAGLAFAVLGATPAAAQTTTDTPAVGTPQASLAQPMSRQSDYLGRAVPAAQQEEAEFGVPAAVSLGQSIVESGWGTAAPNNNYFGIKCSSSGHGPIAGGCADQTTRECNPDGSCYTVTQSFRTYASITDSFRDHGYLLRNYSIYANAFNYRNDPDQFLREVAKAGYATDPAYVTLVLNVMHDNNLAQYDGAVTDPANVPDGTLLREPNGTIAVADGGAPFRFAGPDEYHQAGYQDGQWRSVADGFLARMPQTPHNGTLVRDAAGGAISVIAGGAALHFATVDELNGAGYGSTHWFNVPGSALAGLPPAPADRTLLRDPGTGAVYVVAGGAKFHFTSVDQFHNAGYADNTWVTSPPSAVAGLADTPATGTVVRNPAGGALYVVAGGAKFHFATSDDYHNAGYADGQWTNLPGEAFDRFGTLPADGTLVRDPGGSIYVVAGGTKQYFDSMEEYVALGYPDRGWATLPAGATATVPDGPIADGTVLRTADHKIFVTAGGAPFYFDDGDEYVAGGYRAGQWIHVSAYAVLHLATTAKDGTLVKKAGDTQVWQITAGKRTAATAAGKPVTTIAATALAAIPLG